MAHVLPEGCLIPVPTNPGHSICPTFLAQVMPKSTENVGMTFAKNWTYRAPEIYQNGNESTFRKSFCNYLSSIFLYEKLKFAQQKFDMTFPNRTLLNKNPNCLNMLTKILITSICCKKS